MSHFSAIDASPDPQSLVSSLDASAAGLAAMKAYVAAAARRAVPGGLMIDIGCGAGHDLELLAGAGLVPLGVDPSAVMLAEARRRTSTATPLARADGARLPFRDRSVDGCRIERVLQHADEPRAILAEAARVLRTGGFLAAFEPDWTSLRIETEVPGAQNIGARLHSPRQPDIGRQLGELIAACGFEILDEVTEASRCESITGVPVDVGRALQRLVDHETVDWELAARWITEQRNRDAGGEFRASWTKTLVVARRRRRSQTDLAS